MLKLNPNGGIELCIDHLLGDRPKTFADVVNRYAKFDIFLFYHVISSPTCRYESRHGSGRVPSEVAGLTARERFLRILGGGVINGNAKSYFVNKHKSSLTPSQIDSLKSVSFTLCDTESLPNHFDARKSRYAICFFHDFLEVSGIRRVIYLNDQSKDQAEKIVFTSPYLVEMWGKKYDMRWENEWRIRTAVTFSEDDVAFLVVPDEEYSSITKWLDTAGKYYVVLPSSIYEDRLTYLRMIPMFDHSSWHQIRIFDDLLMDFDEFLEPTVKDRQEMKTLAGEYLDCLAKADIHEQYEHRFTSRFLSFLGALDDSVKAIPSLRKHEAISANAQEPWHSSRELVIAAFEKLFQIQQERITAKW